MENIKTSEKAETENETPKNEILDVDEKEAVVVEAKPLIDLHLERNETKKREALENYCQRAVLCRDARQTEVNLINNQNGKPCLGKGCPGCTICIEKAVYKNGKLEMTQAGFQIDA